jgi:membrane-associated phospholipid phosphatase
VLDEIRKWRAALCFFAVVSVCVTSYIALDRRAALFCAVLGPGTKEIFGLLTRLGISTPYLVATLAGLVYFRFLAKNKELAHVAAFLFLAVALSGLANDLIKVLVGRSRPGLLLSHGFYGFKPFSGKYIYASFPSGHSNTIASFCYGLHIVAERFALALLLIALAVMASRVVVGAHFPSDVLFGAYLGVVITGLLAEGFEKKGLKIRGRLRRRPSEGLEDLAG